MLKAKKSGIHVSFVAEGDPAKTFSLIVDELTSRLETLKIDFAPGPSGWVRHGTDEVGRVTVWRPGERIVLSWRQASWEPEKLAEIEIALKPFEGGTQVAVDYRGLEAIVSGAELTGWFAREIVAPLVRATTPQALGDWITDRRARRPFGMESRNTYRDPLYHYPAFRVILIELDLKPSDYLLEVGCGGGAFLTSALRSGCRAAAIDHSREMVRLAREVNSDSIAEGKLEITEADAEKLPFPNNTFTCAAMHGVFGFLQNPVLALSEIRRVLVKGGRLVLLGSDPGMRGTPAAPEPIASRLLFYNDDELERLGRSAGFESVVVVRRDMEQYAKDVGVPAEHLPLFQGPGGPFLIAVRG